MTTETTAPVQITQVLPPRDVLSLADFELLGFETRAKLRRFLTAHHVPVVVDGKTLRFTRADILAGLARGARPLASRKAPAKKPEPSAFGTLSPRLQLKAG